MCRIVERVNNPHGERWLHRCRCLAVLQPWAFLGHQNFTFEKTGTLTLSESESKKLFVESLDQIKSEK